MVNIDEQDSNCWTKFKHCFQNINLFPSVSPSINRLELRIQRISTVLFIVLSILLLAIPLSYILSVRVTNTINIANPSLEQYSQLYSTYSNTLKCTCTQVEINYGKFVRVKYKLHQVCNSVFVFDGWISHLATTNDTAIYETDFRVTGPRAFQALRILCELANRTISDSLTWLYSSQYVSVYLAPSELLQSKIKTLITQFRSSTKNSFLLSLSMIQGATQANALFSGLQTNYKLSVMPGIDNVLSVAKKYNGCSCDVSPTCIEQSVIYDHSNAAKFFKVPGFYTGCNVIESLLQSNLECFFNQMCINTLQSYLLLSPIVLPALSSSLPKKYLVNSTIQELLNNLMIKKWTASFTYTEYHKQCQPTQCSYTVDTRYDTIYIVIIMFLITGGPIPVLKFFISILMKIIACCIRKSTRQIIPETMTIPT